jgi:tetratricopeptide (TPR) repeat protein
MRYRFALRVVAAALAGTCVWYLVEGTHPVKALLACIVFGVPAAFFAATGSLRTWRSKAQPIVATKLPDFHWAKGQPAAPRPTIGDRSRAIAGGVAPFVCAGAIGFASYVVATLPSEDATALQQETTQRRGVTAFKPGPPAPAPIPEGPPFVGEPGVDAFDYPVRRPDATVLLALLQQKRFVDLDAAMDAYQDAFEADFRKESWPRLAIDAFAVPDLRVQPWIDAWIEASPESFGAWAARASWHDAMAWELRGDRYSNKTMESQFAAMHVQHAEAIADYERALSLRPKLVAALQGMMWIARTAGDDAQMNALFERALKICPRCYGVRASLVLARGPRWGGTHALMDEAAAATPVKRNRKLALLAGLSAYDRCRTLYGEKQYEEALIECTAAERHGPLIEAMCQRAEILNRQKRYAEALPVTETALSLDPQQFDCLWERETARRFTKDYVGAAEDLLTLRRLQPFANKLASRIEWTMQRLRYDAQQAAKAGDKDEETKLRALANAILPGGGDPPGGVSEDGIAELQAAVDAAPDDFDLRLKLDGALAARRRFPEIIAMWNAFLDTHPDHARAWRERGGAKWHAKDRAGAIADTERACELGFDVACRDVPRMRKR